MGVILMDRDTIIKWADENGLWDYFDLEGDSVGLLMLERLAKLVAEHVIKDAPDYKMGYADGVAVEREACAKVADSAADNIGPIEFDVGASIAASIRARGNHD
jgi:hypothetical protein